MQAITISFDPTSPFTAPTGGEQPPPEPEVSPIERQRRAIAEALGADVRTANAGWVRLMREGVIAHLRVRRWRALVKSDWADFGLSGWLADDDLPEGATPEQKQQATATRKKLDEIFKRGERRLLPKPLFDQLNSVESNARKCVERYSYRTHWGYFIPATVYAELKTALAVYEAQYFGLRDEIAQGYDRIFTTLTLDYTRQATTAWLVSRGKSDTRSLSLLEQAELGRFKQEFVQSIVRHLPSKEEIYDSFGFDLELSYIPLPSLLAEDEAERERIQAARDLESERERMVKQMQRDVIAEAERQKIEMVDGFYRDLVRGLRAEVYTVCTDVLAAIEKNGGKLVGPSASRLKNMMAQVEKLNFMGDRAMTASMDKLRPYLAQAAVRRDMDDISRVLRSIATVTRATLLDLGEAPRSARDWGVADIPTPELVRRAQRDLDLPDIQIDPLPQSQPLRFM